jgi:hypothetical protein
MKAALIAVFALILIVSQSTSALATIDNYLDPVVTSVTKGQDYVVEVKINTDEEITGYEISVNYNESVVSVSLVEDGTIFGTCTNECMYLKVNVTGEVTLAGLKISEGSPFTGEGILGTITFHADATGDSQIIIAGDIMIDENMDEIIEEPPPQEEPPPIINNNNNGGGGGGSFAGICTSQWNCTEWSTCSGGIQKRLCTDTKNCEDDYNEDQPCGGALYHGGYPGAEGYVTTSGSGTCNEGTRVCGSEGVVECRDSRLVKVESCEFGCERGVCLQQTGLPTGEFILDPGITIYTIFIIVILIFGGAIAFYGLK